MRRPGRVIPGRRGPDAARGDKEVACEALAVTWLHASCAIWGGVASDCLAKSARDSDVADLPRVRQLGSER